MNLWTSQNIQIALNLYFSKILVEIAKRDFYVPVVGYIIDTDKQKVKL